MYSGDCSFEFGLCGWKAINPGSALDLRPQDWKLADRTQNFGSLKDHTFRLDAGGYAYFDTINIQTKTWLISPTVSANVAVCLQFWFVAAASEASNIQVKRQFVNGTMSPLWGVQFSDLELAAGAPLSAWLPAQVYIAPLASESAVVFEGNANNGGFALDDVRMTTGSSATTGCETRPLYKSNLAQRLDNVFQFAGLQGTETQYRINFNLDHQSLGLLDRRPKALDGSPPAHESDEVEHI